MFTPEELQQIASKISLTLDTPESIKLQVKQIALAQKELKVIKKELSAVVSNINQQASQASADSFSSVVSNILGKRKLAGSIRADKRRAIQQQKQTERQPYLELKEAIEQLILEGDRLKLLAEEYLLDPEGVTIRLQAEEEKRRLAQQETEKSLQAKNFPKFWHKIVIAIGFVLLTKSCFSLSDTTPNQEVAETQKLENTFSESISEAPQSTNIIETPKTESQPEEIAENSSLASNKFNFPKDSCGDTPTESTETWYPVFIDEGNLDEIRSRYCRDAGSTVREKTGKPTVQVASFTGYQKALEFAKAVGGEVGGSEQDSSNMQEQSPAPSKTPKVSNSVTQTETTSPNPLSSKPSKSSNSVGTSRVSGSGKCENPDDVDSRGRRCGARAARAREGGR